MSLILEKMQNKKKIGKEKKQIRKILFFGKEMEGVLLDVCRFSVKTLLLCFSLMKFFQPALSVQNAAMLEKQQLLLINRVVYRRAFSFLKKCILLCIRPWDKQIKPCVSAATCWSFSKNNLKTNAPSAPCSKLQVKTQKTELAQLSQCRSKNKLRL